MTSHSVVPAAVSPPKSTSTPLTVCHWLPCNIDYDGMAPVHQYFAPQQVEGDEVHAAQLRGRGLLSVISSQPTMQGAVLSFTNGGEIQEQATFQEIREWHHEHSIAVAKQEPSQVQTAQDWCQVARAVHDPIPVEEDK